ncbi:hypothetical protein CDIK_0571 [Cucumispora dikerogammari]|nr:hypothetical protein CDIK_0571 [Cucumispora dikerogammari]
MYNFSFLLFNHFLYDFGLIHLNIKNIQSDEQYPLSVKLKNLIKVPNHEIFARDIYSESYTRMIADGLPHYPSHIYFLPLLETDFFKPLLDPIILVPLSEIENSREIHFKQSLSKIQERSVMMHRYDRILDRVVYEWHSPVARNIVNSVKLNGDQVYEKTFGSDKLVNHNGDQVYGNTFGGVWSVKPNGDQVYYGKTFGSVESALFTFYDEMRDMFILYVSVAFPKLGIRSETLDRFFSCLSLNSSVEAESMDFQIEISIDMSCFINDLHVFGLNFTGNDRHRAFLSLKGVNVTHENNMLMVNLTGNTKNMNGYLKIEKRVGQQLLNDTFVFGQGSLYGPCSVHDQNIHRDPSHDPFTVCSSDCEVDNPICEGESDNDSFSSFGVESGYNSCTGSDVSSIDVYDEPGGF